MVKYRCVYCEKILDESDAVIVGVHSGWKFPTSTIMCSGCLELFEKSDKACYDCKYFKSGSKYLFFRIEPCKSCNDHHSKWEDKEG